MPAMDVIVSEYAWKKRPCMNESERALSDGFRASRDSEAGLGRGSGWSSSLYYGPCSPLARDDTVGSPLQASIDAHAARDSLSLPRSTAVEAGSTRARATHDVVKSIIDTASSSLCSAGGSSNAGRRRQSASWSPDGTTVAPSSWLSGADGDGGGGGLFDASTAQPESTTVGAGQARRGFDAESDGDGYADARAGEGNADPGRKADTWTAVRDGRYPTGNAQSLPTAYGDASGIAPATKGPWFQRRRTTTPREYDREPSLVPSFYSEGGPPSLASDGRAGGRGSGRGLTGMRSALRRRYVAVSYKVRLAVFRTERTVGRRFSRRRRRMGEKEEGGDV
jgi:hypothetical protein